MADNLQTAMTISQGGLDSTENHLYLDQNRPGGAVSLVNYEVGLYGGYRRIDGFEYFDANYPTIDDTNATGPVLGIAIYRNIDDTETIFAMRAQKVGNVYKIYKYSAGVGWVAQATGLVQNTLTIYRSILKIRFHKVVFGGVSYIIFVDGVNNPIIWDGTTWRQPTLAGLGTDVSPGGDQMLAAPSYVTSFKNHVFYGGDAQYPATVFHSAPEAPFDYTAASGAGQIPVGFTIRQIRPFRDALYVFGKVHLKGIVVSSTTFVLQDVANNIGTIASDSVQEINGDIIFLAQDGVRTVSGTDKIGDINLGSISKQVQRLVNSIQDNYDLVNLNSVVIKKKSQFRYFISSANTTSEGIGMIGGLRTAGDQAGWEFSELNGIRASCVENDYLDDVETTLHGDYDGSVYIQESGRTFNGSPVISVYSTPFLTFGDYLLNKVGRRLRTFYKPEGSLQIGIKVDYDWLDPATLSPTLYSESSTSVVELYDTGLLYDSGLLYGTDDIYPVINTDIQGSFKSIRLTYTTSGDYAPHTIQGFLIDFSTSSKRGSSSGSE